jgi:putrescine transport system substrate-binding protein
MLETKLLAGKSGYDVVFPGVSNGQHLIRSGALQPIDPEKLAGYGNLDPDILAQLDKRDAGRTVGVPYTWGTVGISYDANAVTERIGEIPENVLDLIFDPELTAKLEDCGIGLLDAPSEVIPVALIYLGLDPESGKPEDMDKVKALFDKVRDDYRYFNSARIINDLANSEVCVALSYNGDAGLAYMRAQEAGLDLDLRYNIPSIGTMMFIDLMAIPADAPHPENAYRFIEYMLNPEVIAKTSNLVYFANANKESLPYVSDDVKGDPNIYPPQEVKDKLVAFSTLPQDITRVRTRAWTDIKAN